MSEMIERVARALALADLDEETREVVDLDAHMVHVRGHYEELARAAIEAMREPSDAMERAGNEGLRANGLGDVEGDDSTSAWYAMIDAALSEPDK